MSGGPIFDLTGELIAISSSSFDIGGEEEPISYATSVWPIMGTIIDVSKLDPMTFPKSNMLRVQELAQRKFIHVSDLGRLKITDVGHGMIAMGLLEDHQD